MFLNEYILHHLYVIVYSKGHYSRITINTSFDNIYTKYKFIKLL